jgi:hypothetical protein
VPTLTLVTCWPFGAIAPGGPLRYVVVAEASAPVPRVRGRRPLVSAPVVAGDTGHRGWRSSAVAPATVARKSAAARPRNTVTTRPPRAIATRRSRARGT